MIANENDEKDRKEDEEEQSEGGLDSEGKKRRKAYTISKQREHWTEEEHNKFLESLKLFDRDWKKIEKFIGTKTVIQIRSHAQKWFLKVQKNKTGERIPPARPKRKSSGKEKDKSKQEGADEPLENKEPKHKEIEQKEQNEPRYNNNNHHLNAQRSTPAILPIQQPLYIYPVHYNPITNQNNQNQREPPAFTQWMSQNNLLPIVFAHNFDTQEALDLHNQQQEQYQQAQMYIQQVMPQYHSRVPIPIPELQSNSQFNPFLGNIYDHSPLSQQETIQLMRQYQPETNSSNDNNFKEIQRIQAPLHPQTPVSHPDYYRINPQTSPHYSYGQKEMK